MGKHARLDAGLCAELGSPALVPPSAFPFQVVDVPHFLGNSVHPASGRPGYCELSQGLGGRRRPARGVGCCDRPLLADPDLVRNGVVAIDPAAS